MLTNSSRSQSFLGANSHQAIHIHWDLFDGSLAWFCVVGGIQDLITAVCSTFWEMDTLAPRNGPIIISSVLLLYDYLLTFDLEVNYIWTHPLTFRSTLFFLNRYTPFVDTFLSLSGLSVFLTVHECETRSQVISVFIFIGIAISEIILMLRVYALWGCRRWVLVLFLCMSIGEIICVALIVWKQLTSIHMLQTLEGCISSGSSNELLHLAPFVLLALTETVLAILSVIKGYQDLRNTRERWVVELYKDGLLYYLYLLVLSIFNIFSPWIRPAWGPFLVTPQRVLHSLFCNRILFFLLKVGVDEEQKERERERLQGGYYGGRAGDWGTSVEEGEGVRFTTVQMDVVGTVR
ncbi:hypothetical protein Moror_5960 [Moniliophthora roreri MCA 2997]|uniref:DUF6533 domain-containing protein n=1 Tax=Moniliophthora roreri (strain MCA 2997) TaxID=1381753 RepID=V2WEU1_MONRO|nr:hypothetical protein Moror_5960 [Moniliophthora roreri MCA 2997]